MANPLARYLKKNKTTARAFAREHGMEPVTVWRIVNGHRQCGMAMAVRIERATGGAVRVEDWVATRAAA